MIRSSLVIAALAFGLSLALHGAGLSLRHAEEAPEIAGGAAQPVARLGDSFADMVQGELTPQPADLELDPVRPDAMPNNPPDPSAAVEPVPSQIAPVAPLPPETARAATPLETLQPMAPGERLAALPEALSAPDISPRPRPRAPPQALASRPAGNAESAATRGASDGTPDATAVKAAPRSAPQTTQRANAAASSYPGLVLRQIARVRPPRVTARGAAIVRLSIAENGALAAVGIARSSGNAQLDQAALQVVRNAGPFPPPPPGARRSFSVEIKGR